MDGFRLAFDRFGSPDRPSVVLLHGWPGHRRDYRQVASDLAETADVVIPDLRGFGESDKHLLNPAEFYSADAQARSVAGLIDELNSGNVSSWMSQTNRTGAGASTSRAGHRPCSFPAVARSR